jgi:hypothetical protein
MLQRNLLQPKLHQLQCRWVIDFIETYKQACKQIRIGTWVWISCAQHGLGKRLDIMHGLHDRHEGAE